MAISRRAFLQAAGLGATAVAVTACGPTMAPPGQTMPSASPTPTTTTRPPAVPADWEKLRGQLAGKLVLPSDAGYATAKLAYNPLFDSRQPAAVAQVANPSDVQACVALAYASRIPIAARSGGHSYVGYSTPDSGLVVDLGGMKDVQVASDGTATIGAGARLMEVYAALADAGRCLPAGSCPTVGIGGLTLGGGVGVLTTKYGLTCDKLVSAQIVTGDGKLRTVSASQEPDLFWALRGGGGGNFGIVTSFTFQTEPAPQLTVFQLQFPSGSVGDVLGGWQQFVADAPDELWTTMGVSGGNPPTCRINGCFVGSQSGLNPLLNKLVAATGTQPSDRYTLSKSYLDAMRYFGGCASFSNAQCTPSWNGNGVLKRESFTATSRVLAKPLSDTGKFAELMAGRNGMDVLLDSIGGAAARVGATDTAFPHRGSLATVQIYQGSTAASVRTAVGEVRDNLGDLIGAGAYVNYIDAGVKDWGTAYYGSNVTKLRKVAQQYDPDGVLSFDQSVAKA
ncbi:FAD-binding oxidoreductase [Kutzneria sp. CA-103260]|uniref:FAD-binding oxidoreductase n=1 Tax=Kutzneria sp. CA-103260 TaxID=2802641 RepID=UPI001BA66482|nr:FAD-binding oxidoreductase [Kutzneria sp. CA-103260]QUQ70710.1 FAD-binding dehydrogenase [Kutzneria sp. CA-103260]